MAVRKTIKETKNLTAFQKVNDWYARHNFGTRLSMMVFLGMYVMVVATNVDYTIFASIDENATKIITETAKEATNPTNPANLELVKIVGYFAFGAMMLVTLGDNALTKVGDIIVKVKGGKKDNSLS